MKVKIAELIIEIDNKFPETEQFFKDYLTEESAEPDFKASTTAQEDERCKRWYFNEENMLISDGMAEFDWLKHKVSPKLPEYGAFKLHASVVELDGEAYAFSGPSGYGKSAHANLWLREFGKRARIINGDNPIIRPKNGTFYAYGTPWCGKEQLQVNVGVPLKAICYIMQKNENVLNKLTPYEAYYRLVGFSEMYLNRDNTETTLALYEQLVEKVPFYQIDCNMEPEAVRVSYEGMSGKSLKK